MAQAFHGHVYRSREYTKLWTLKCLSLLGSLEGSDHYKQHLFWNLRPIHEFVTTFPIACLGLNVPGKNNPSAGLDRKSGRQAVKAPRFQNNRHMKVARLSSLRTGRFYPQKILPVLISVSACVNPRATVNKKTPTPSGIEPATFWLVQQSLKQTRHECMGTLSTTFCLEVQ
jgi:hypothetical protein